MLKGKGVHHREHGDHRGKDVVERERERERERKLFDHALSAP
jgi:hypothetical protein